MKKQTKIHLLTGLIILNLAFIWGNSAMTGEQSGAVSGSLLASLCELFPFFAGENGHFLLRKIAHFSEFACLGLLCGARRHAKGQALFPAFLLFGLAPACIDETIQLYVPARASSLIDVWIDTAGFAAGCLILLAGCTILKHFKTQK